MLTRLLEAPAADLRDRGGIELRECFVDGTLPRRKRCGCVGRTKRGKGTKIMALADGAGLPLAVCIGSASPHEVRFVHETLAARFIDDVPERPIGDLAYDGDQLRFELSDDGIDVIAPHLSNRTGPKRQDGRALRRYRRRWKVERVFARLHDFRRLVVRYERHAENFLGMVRLGCIRILLRSVMHIRAGGRNSGANVADVPHGSAPSLTLGRLRYA